ncbi:MAG TPA: DHHA1 domain-containing protein, partial [Verrucomicrobiae bacterium]|nr:DHHA1 domain-containing protein [Verrucomicrobiae bacterium]
ENRILVNRGLERLNTTARVGLVALKKVAEIARPITGYEVGFQLAPRLNAAGRLEHALEALQLLLTSDHAEAERIALRLDAQNRERQKIERSMAETVIAAVRARFDPAKDFVVVEGQLLWHIGVVGIVASRVVQEFHRPAIILGGNGEEWRGSGRSVEGFDLAAALRECGGLLLRHGGHAMAAGLSLSPDNLDSLRQALNELVRRSLSAEQLVPRLRLDAEVTLRELTLENVRELQLLQQTGMENPPVHIYLRNLSQRGPARRMGTSQQHAKFWVTDRQVSCEAVWWGIGAGSLPEGNFDLACVPELNEYNGDGRVQLRVLDWRPAVSL